MHSLFPNRHRGDDFQYLIDLGTLILHACEYTIDDTTKDLQAAENRIRKYLAKHAETPPAETSEMPTVGDNRNS